MRYALFFAFYGLFLLFGGSASAQERYFETLYDVPIMAGLVENADMGMVFDKPDGRIAQAQAYISPSLNKDLVLDFYAQTLPQMGWEKLSLGEYQREGEKIRIFFQRDVVVLRLEPL